MNTKRVLFIKASEVASLIGENKWNPTEKCIYDVLKRNRVIREPEGDTARLDDFAELTQVKQVSRAKVDEDEIIATVNKIIDRVNAGIGSSKEIIAEYNATVKIPEVPASPETSNELNLDDKINIVEETIVDDGLEIIEPTIKPGVIKQEPEVVTEPPKETPLVKPRSVPLKHIDRNEAKSLINRSIGIQEEKENLDQYEKDSGKLVVGRNERLYNIIENGFTIRGKIDGYIAADKCVIEAKARKSLYNRASFAYDIIQLRVYMKMTGAEYGIIRNGFGKNKPARDDRFEANEEIHELEIKYGGSLI